MKLIGKLTRCNQTCTMKRTPCGSTVRVEKYPDLQLQVTVSKKDLLASSNMNSTALRFDVFDITPAVLSILDTGITIAAIIITFLIPGEGPTVM